MAEPEKSGLAERTRKMEFVARRLLGRPPHDRPPSLAWSKSKSQKRSAGFLPTWPDEWVRMEPCDPTSGKWRPVNDPRRRHRDVREADCPNTPSVSRFSSRHDLWAIPSVTLYHFQSNANQNTKPGRRPVHLPHLASTTVPGTRRNRRATSELATIKISASTCRSSPPSDDDTVLRRPVAGSAKSDCGEPRPGISMRTARPLLSPVAPLFIDLQCRGTRFARGNRSGANPSAVLRGL